MADSQIQVTYVDHMGSDLSVVNSAKVSFGKRSSFAEGSTRLKDKDERLIAYLAKHKHTSPFGHCFASFHVKAPIFVARQLVKHKFLRWNEISRRYVDDKPEIFIPSYWRGKAENVKQGSDSSVSIDTSYYDRDDGYNSWDGDAAYVSLEAYEKLLELGVAPEQARMVLPQSTMTEWYWSGSLDAFADMCNLRCKPDTQYESMVVASQVDKSMKKLFPVSWTHLRKGN